MARGAWIPLGLGFATAFPKVTSYRRSLNPTSVGIQRRVHDDAVVPVVRLARPICSLSPSTLHATRGSGRFWASGRELFPYKIMEEFPVIQPQWPAMVNFGRSGRRPNQRLYRRQQRPVEPFLGSHRIRSNGF
jgi:hypothetical protein